MTVTIVAPAAVTPTPRSVQFSDCGEQNAKAVTFSSAQSGSYAVASTWSDVAGDYNTTPSNFMLHVSAPTNTSPTVSIGGVAQDASYNKGSVPAATCEVTDAEDGNSTFPATLSSVTGANASDGVGSQTASCSYTDRGGLTDSASATYGIVDPSAPVVSSVLSPASPDGNDGWYTTDVNLTWTVTEPESPGSLVKTGCASQAITDDQQATSYSCSATSAGGSAAEQRVTIKRDGTAPSVSYDGVVLGTAGANGWYTSDVTAGFSATDAVSGPTTAAATVTTSGQGAAVLAASPVFTDAAGNASEAGAVSRTYKIDQSAPTNVAFVGGPSAASSHHFGSVPAAPTCTADDAVSGLASCVVEGYSTAVGPHTMTATATDNAGNTVSVGSSYTVLSWTTAGFYAPVDMGGVLNRVKGGSTVPLKFELFAGPRELDTTAAVVGFTTMKVTCETGTDEAPVETVTTGGTSLRYDSTAGQFIQNWKVPTTVGCYRATVKAADGSSTSADFKVVK
ncbi:PxKF domain-containing protein [Ornithinicoccus halotolerans]|uniref:PxKF domain-containing protein n=1 Tax=Ornithinicoccus halotolerans TaxID=1748220 RepID=UPI001885ADE7|nr:PxKF domain-containing protein [Ornithinicoccus halotolerans]